MKKILIVSGSRADYNINRWVIKELKKSKKLKPVSLYLDSKLYSNNFTFETSILDINGSTIFQKGSNCIQLIGTLLEKQKPDYMLVLGDRWEILQTCFAASLHNIPIIHLGGGETSKGAYDDNFRDCITLLSKYHFVITETAKDKLYTLGVIKNVYVVGSPRMDYLNTVQINNNIIKELGLDDKKPVILVIYHSETKASNIKEQTDIFFQALFELKYQYIMIYPNYDVNSDYICKKIDKFKGIAYKTPMLKLENYVSVLNKVSAIVGNSSAGIMEAPTFRLPAVNVGDRQKGREMTGNVIQCGHEKEKIKKCVNIAIDQKFHHFIKDRCKSFGDGRVSEKIVNILEREL